MDTEDFVLIPTPPDHAINEINRTALRFCDSLVALEHVQLPPKRKWRCTFGHKWESHARDVAICFEAREGNMFQVGEVIDICPLCFVALLKDRCGQVREDT